MHPRTLENSESQQRQLPAGSERIARGNCFDLARDFCGETCACIFNPLVWVLDSRSETRGKASA